MATTLRHIEDAKRIGRVEECEELSKKYSENIYGVVIIQIAQKDHLISRAYQKVARTWEIQNSINTITKDLDFYNKSIKNMERNTVVRARELGGELTIKDFQIIVDELSKGIQDLQKLLPEVEREEQSKAALHGQQMFAIATITVIGFLALRNYFWDKL